LPIELSYYPLYLVLGALVPDFLHRRVPAMLVDLQQSGALPSDAFPRVVNEFDSRLNHPLAVRLCGALGGLAIAVFYVGVLKPPLQISWWGVPITAIDVLLGYAVGVASWKAVAVARQVGAWSRRGELTVRPLHPDGAGGLEAVGRLFFSLSLI